MFSFFKKHKIFAISITAGLLMLLFKYRYRFGLFFGNGYFQNPCLGKVTSEFGERVNPVTGQKQFHNGVDVKAFGDVVYAPSDCKLSTITSSVINGVEVLSYSFDCSNGYKVGFAHVVPAMLPFDIDQTFKKGELLFVLDEPNDAVTGKHLHFTVTNPSGDKIDPKNIFDFATKFKTL